MRRFLDMRSLQRQRGAVVFVLFALLATVGVLSFGVWMMSQDHSPKLKRERMLQAHLQEAVEALKGYAQSDSNSCKLPKPDMDPIKPDMDPIECNSGTCLGYLPTKKLGLGERQIKEERLWYVVANCNADDCDPNNPNNPNILIDVFRSDGFTEPSYSDSYAAVIFYPGPALGGLSNPAAESNETPPKSYCPEDCNAEFGSADGFKPVLTPLNQWRGEIERNGQALRFNDVGVALKKEELCGNNLDGDNSDGGGSGNGSANEISLDHTLNGQAAHSGFHVAGSGASINPNDAALGGKPSLHLQNASGASGGCMWFDPVSLGLSPDSWRLKGKSWRTFFRFKFDAADPPVGSDRGYGFTFLLAPGAHGRPSTCGQQQNMGVISSGTWQDNVFAEFDIYRHPAHNDPQFGASPRGQNHFAFKRQGILEHQAGNGAPFDVCGAAPAPPACFFATENHWEESPTPLEHAVRLEFAAQCNLACSDCSGSETTHVRLRAWFDCASDACDLNLDTDREAAEFPPAAQACYPLSNSLEDAYFGLTGGFTSGGNAQGVLIWDFKLYYDAQP